MCTAQYHLMVISVACWCVHGRRLFSDPVTCYMYIFQEVITGIWLYYIKIIHNLMLTLLLCILLPCNLYLASFTSLLVATGGLATRTFANCHKLGRTGLGVLLVSLWCDDAEEFSLVASGCWSAGLTAKVEFLSVWILSVLATGSRTGGTGNG